MRVKGHVGWRREVILMPSYEFLCKSCRKEFALALHMADLDKDGIVCPHCGSKDVERRVESFSAVTSKKS